jgi:hypothetical protein
MAAALGHHAARITGTAQPQLPKDYRLMIEHALVVLPIREAVSFGWECSQRVLSHWEMKFPDDQRPRAAVEATRRWLAARTDASELELAAEAASDAAIEADSPDFTENMDPGLARALHAANSAANTALSASLADSEPKPPPPSYELRAAVSDAASFATLAAISPELEQRWQVGRLSDFFLREDSDQNP